MNARPTWRALAAVALMLVAGCGDSDDTASPATDGATLPNDSVAGPADVAAFCDAASALVTAFGTGGDPSGALAALVETAPASTSDDVSTFAERVGAAAASGDEAAFLDTDVRRSADRAFSGIAAECGYQPVEVDAVEYRFDGVPAEIPAGPTAFALTNTGAQVHEMLLYRRAAGAAGDLVDIVNQDPTVSDGRLDEIGVAFPVAPGEHSVLLADLAAGDYVMVCFLQDGITTIDQLVKGDDGSADSDHRSLGMISAFSVT